MEKGAHACWCGFRLLPLALLPLALLPLALLPLAMFVLAGTAAHPCDDVGRRWQHCAS
jgi:hypothetical protein